MANRHADALAADGLPHAWWLVPAEPWRTRLQAEIEALAADTGGPVFEPHLTLALGALPTSVLDWAALARALPVHVQPVSLQAGPRGHTERYFQTLFIRFGQHPDTLPMLAARRQQLVAAMMDAVSVDERGSASRAAPLPGDTAFTAPTAPAFEPHLSLCYANLAAAERARLATLGGIEGEWIRFDTLVALRPRPGASTMAQVSDWDCFFRVALSLS
ncbi:MAG: hypothetical protein Q4D91_05355 [Lautropia sp.]|nr:hypothetical protein [Lautropia sp.]